MRGRKKSLDEREAEGNRSHEPFSGSNPSPEAGEPEIPGYLHLPAKKHWRRLVPILLKARVLTLADGDMLGCLCQCLARLEKAEGEVRRMGEVCFPPEANAKLVKPYVNPWLDIVKREGTRLKELADHFGMSPKARCGVKLTKREAASDPLNQFLSGVSLPNGEETEEEVEA